MLPCIPFWSGHLSTPNSLENSVDEDICRRSCSPSQLGMLGGIHQTPHGHVRWLTQQWGAGRRRMAGEDEPFQSGSYSCSPLIRGAHGLCPSMRERTTEFRWGVAVSPHKVFVALHISPLLPVLALLKSERTESRWKTPCMGMTSFVCVCVSV
jgi:hypothetical protein